MHWAGLLLLLLLPLLAGCSSGADAGSDVSGVGSGGQYSGGQTGSLIPNCGIAPLSVAGDSVPSGEQAFVFNTRGCPSGLQLSDIVITDPDGASLEVETQALGDGTYLIRGAATLTEGQYEVTLPEGASTRQATIAVAPPAPLPTQVGQLEPLDHGCASSRFTLQPDATLVPFLPLVQLSYSIDEGPARALGDYGVWRPAEQPLVIFVDHCAGGSCLPAGSYNLRVMATIAGETAQPDPATSSFEVDCSGLESDDSHGFAACALQHGAVTGSSRSLIGVLMMLGLVGIRFRSRFTRGIR